MLGNTFKLPYDLEMIESFADTDMLVFEGAQVLEESKEELDDGSIKVIINFDPVSLSEATKQELNVLLESFNSGMEDLVFDLSIEVEYKSLKVEAIINKDGVASNSKLECSCEMSVGGQTISYDLALDYEYQLLPDDYEISSPANIGMENAIETEELPDGAI